MSNVFHTHTVKIGDDSPGLSGFVRFLGGRRIYADGGGLIHGIFVGLFLGLSGFVSLF